MCLRACILSYFQGVHPINVFTEWPRFDISGIIYVLSPNVKNQHKFQKLFYPERRHLQLCQKLNSAQTAHCVLFVFTWMSEAVFQRDVTLLPDSFELQGKVTFLAELLPYQGKRGNSILSWPFCKTHL